MSLLKANKPISAPDVRIQDKPTTRYNGHSVARVASAVFDATGGKATGAYGLGVYLPDNAIIIDAWVDVVTTFTSAGADAGTIALSAQSANDIVSAIAISAAGDVWDAGVRGTKVGTFALDGNAMTAIQMAAAKAASYIKLTARRELTATVATQNLTAGKAVLYVAYVLGE